MDHFQYHNGRLMAEAIAATSLADAVGTPCYVYSQQTLTDHYQRLAAAFAPIDPLICFSVKSNSNVHVLRHLLSLGAGMDLVSGGELHRVLLAGGDPSRCVYAGVGKTEPEIRASIEAGVGWFNIESEQEFEFISAIAETMNGVRHGGSVTRHGGSPNCRGALRINPDVDPHTHDYTNTGKRETKFGVALDDAASFFARHGNNPHCRLTGLHLHLGSPIYSVEPYVLAINKTLTLIDQLAGDGIVIDTLDLGGGFGADYQSNQTPPISTFADAIVPLLADRVRAGLQIILEPGRTIAANAGVLLTRVLYTKQSGRKRFVICDAGMHTLVRPSHYDAFHFIWPCEVAPQFVPDTRTDSPAMDGLQRVDIVGPICETGDFLARDRMLPPVDQGDLLAVFSAGAYGMTMASQYNSMPRPAEVMVHGDAARIIRQREVYDDLTQRELSDESVDLRSRSPVEVGAGT